MTWFTTITVLLADTELKDYYHIWTLVTDLAQQKAHPTYPTPNTERRRAAHRAGQIRLLRLCETAFRGR
jgi:hypothetical protein